MPHGRNGSIPHFVRRSRKNAVHDRANLNILPGSVVIARLLPPGKRPVCQDVFRGLNRNGAALRLFTDDSSAAVDPTFPAISGRNAFFDRCFVLQIEHRRFRSQQGRVEIQHARTGSRIAPHFRGNDIFSFPQKGRDVRAIPEPFRTADCLLRPFLNEAPVHIQLVSGVRADGDEVLIRPDLFKEEASPKINGHRFQFIVLCPIRRPDQIGFQHLPIHCRPLSRSNPSSHDDSDRRVFHSVQHFRPNQLSTHRFSIQLHFRHAMLNMSRILYLDR